jgi:hypothetical protein
MSPKDGAGVPRLQELAFLWIAHLQVAEGATFEQVRQALIEHMRARGDDETATGNTAKFQLARAKRDRYVSNVTDALKALMRLGLLERASLPADGRAAGYYRETTFAATERGEAWAARLRDDRRGAIDELLEMLWAGFPQFAGYLRVVAKGGLTIPLAQWLEFPEPRTRETYVRNLARKVGEAAAAQDLGWAASGEEAHAAITEYLTARLRFASSRQRPDPYPRNQDFVRACEEALVKLAFTRAGEPIDYISHEVLRRWMRELQVASFSYHVPGPTALRLWPTADVTEQGGKVQVRRHVSDQFSDAIVRFLGEAYEEVRQAERSQTPWVPIYRIRAATCCRLRVSERLFDRAFVEFLSGSRGDDLPYRVNVDPAQFGSVPPSERPLRVPTSRGLRDVYTLTLVPHLERSPA